MESKRGSRIDANERKAGAAPTPGSGPKRSTSPNTGATAGRKPRRPKVVEQTEPYSLAVALFRQQIGARIEREYLFHQERKWRIDLAFVDYRVAVEIEGGVWSGGRHTRPKGFLGDKEKYNALASMGWLLLRYTPSELLSQDTIDEIRTTLQNAR